MKEKMTILIAGGSGFVGSQIIGHYQGRHNFINIAKSRSSALTSNNVLVDLSRDTEFLSFSEPIDMVINCMEIEPEGGVYTEEARQRYVQATKNLVELARKSGVKHLIHFSANVSKDAANDYQFAKLLAERAVEHSQIHHIIFKLSVVFGNDSPVERFVNRMLKRLWVPCLVDEVVRVAPVHISDVLSNLDHAFAHDECWNEIYAITGPEPMSFKELMERHAYKKVRYLKLPGWLRRQLTPWFLDAKRHPDALEVFHWLGAPNLKTDPVLVKPSIFY